MHAHIQKVLPWGGLTLTIFFLFFFFYLVDKVKEDQNTAKNGPSLAHQQNAIEMAFRWRADDSFNGV